MYKLNELLLPVWDTDIIYAESLTFTDGESLLMYEPDEIISLYDSHFQTEMRRGIDYTVEGRKIKTAPGSRINSFTHEQLYPSTPIPEHSFACEGGNLLFYEGSYFHDRQYAITYTTSKNTWSGHSPVSARSLLPRTFSKLEQALPLTVTLFGDSISVGANSSKFTKTPPYQMPFGEMLIAGLKEKYKSEIDFHNPSVGGKSSEWGVQTVRENVCCRKNDLVIIAFGANDGNRTKEEFTDNISKIICCVRDDCPETEFIIVATSLPNPLLTDDKAKFYDNQEYFSCAMDALVDTGVAKADITKMQAELLRHKRFIDITANNVNHPNDFFHRLHAQYLLSMFEYYSF